MTDDVNDSLEYYHLHPLNQPKTFLYIHHFLYYLHSFRALLQAIRLPYYRNQSKPYHGKQYQVKH